MEKSIVSYGVWKTFEITTKNGKIHHPTEPAMIYKPDNDFSRFILHLTHIWVKNGRINRPYQIYNAKCENINSEASVALEGTVGTGFGSFHCVSHEKYCFPVSSGSNIYAYHGTMIVKEETPWHQLQEWNSTTSTKERLIKIQV